MISKLIQMCATLLGQHHLMNAYKMYAGWLITFVDKRGWQVNLCHSATCCTAGHWTAGRCAFAFLFGLFTPSWMCLCRKQHSAENSDETPSVIPCDIPSATSAFYPPLLGNYLCPSLGLIPGSGDQTATAAE